MLHPGHRRVLRATGPGLRVVAGSSRSAGATAFPTAIIGLLGWAFLPWTTVAYVFVYTNGMDILDWALVIVAIFVDFASYGGSAYRRKDLGWNY